MCTKYHIRRGRDLVSVANEFNVGVELEDRDPYRIIIIGFV